MSSNNYVKGQWNVLCQVCGQEFKNVELRRRWDNVWACSKDWETEHPQDLLRLRPDSAIPPWTRPEPEDSFVTVHDAARDSNGNIVFDGSGNVVYT